MSSIIHSLEPLTPQQCEAFRSAAGLTVSFIDRNAIANASGLGGVTMLICRDRDNIDLVLDLCPNLKLLLVVSVGVERLPFARLAQRQIVVSNVAGINAGIMSDYALAMILAHCARLRENILNQSRHFWKPYQCVDSPEGKRLLVVGAGRTGKLIARKAKPFGMECVGVSRRGAPCDDFERVVTMESLDKELPEADFVICALPLTPSTVRLFDARRFALMKPSALFVNIARGGHVVQSDLADALRKGTIGAAALDVFEREPLAPDSEMWDVPNLIVTPHSSGRLSDFMDRAAVMLAGSAAAFLEGRAVPNSVDLESGY